MNFFLSAICLLNVAGLIVLAYAVRTAPAGFEDQNGFHVGDQPFDPTAQRELVFALSRA